ncbi:hypothetical protein F4778DRAFT_779235 [Xylariomycetidae sp. FL2044]|nr:hypothetical protein F4778DRAFT_779235 [Xylariomycetidae sp. FL2044]
MEESADTYSSSIGDLPVDKLALDEETTTLAAAPRAIFTSANTKSTKRPLPDSSNAETDDDSEDNSRAKKPKLSRSSKACDQCRAAKEGCKLSYGGTSCKRCLVKELDCSWNVPSLKRGPRKGGQIPFELAALGAITLANPKLAADIAKFLLHGKLPGSDQSISQIVTDET